MQRTGMYRAVPHDRTRTMKDVEAWLGNSLATILAGLAIAAGVIGMLIAFGYMNEDSTEPFEDGIIWMIGGLILGLCANVFRREHHIVDSDGSGASIDIGRYDDERRYEGSGRYEEQRVPPHTHE